MPDGLELFPLNGGKLEIMGDIIEASSADELSEDSLGNCMMMLYASRYDDIKDMSLEDITEGGREIGLAATLEDRQAAEEVILADFDALSASMAKSPKAQALMKQEPNHSNGQHSSGQDSPLATAEASLTPFPPLKSSKSSSQKTMPTSRTDKSLSGKAQTRMTSQESGSDLSDSETVTG